MKKSLICAVLSVLMVCVFVFSLPLTSFAVSTYNMYTAEPAKSPNQGYINILMGNGQVITISWTLVAMGSYVTDAGGSDLGYNGATDVSMVVEITKSGTLKLYVHSSDYSNVKVTAGFGRYLSGGSDRTWFGSEWNLSVGDVAYSYSNTSAGFLGYQIYGNGIILSSDFGTTNNKAFEVVWDGQQEVNLHSKLTELISLCYELVADDKTMIAQLDKIFANTNDLETLLTSIDQHLYNIGIQNNNILRILQQIRDILQGSGESTFEEPSTDNINDYNKNEDELVSGADDTGDIEQEIEDFEIDANASGVIWSIIQSFLNQNEKVFGLVIGVLCIGIIALILNR